MLLHDADVDEGLGIHHMGHAGERSRGDSRLRDWPDAEWRIVRDKDDQDDQDNPAGPRFFSAYGRDVDEPEQQLALNLDGMRRLTIVGGSRRESRTQTAITAVVEVVTTTPGVNSTDLRKAVREVTGGQAPEVDKARYAALKQGLIRTETVCSRCPSALPRRRPLTAERVHLGPTLSRTRWTRSSWASMCPMSLEDTDTVTTPVGTREQPSARPDTDTVEPAPLPPCTVCGEPTRDRKRQVHQRCLTEEPLTTTTEHTDPSQRGPGRGRPRAHRHGAPPPRRARPRHRDDRGDRPARRLALGRAQLEERPWTSLTSSPRKPAPCSATSRRARSATTSRCSSAPTTTATSSSCSSAGPSATSCATATPGGTDPSPAARRSPAGRTASAPAPPSSPPCNPAHN